MSGALNNIYNNVSNALYQHSVEMARLQEQAATGSRINRPSDDPSSSYRIVTLNSQERSLGNYVDNISEIIGTLEFSSTVIVDVASTLTETRVRLTQISGGIYNEQSRKMAAGGINDLLEQIVTLANTKHTGQYLFGGGGTASAPYLVERTNGEITNVTYQGSYENRNIEVAPSIKSSAFYVGNNIFHSDDRGEPAFLGNTGAKAGTGTSNVRGDTWLTVTGSAGNWTLSIDGGTPVASDGTQTNLVIEDASGQVLYVDTRLISSAGVDLVRVPGTYDIFNTLISIRDILNNEKELSATQLQEALDGSLVSLEEISGLLTQAEVAVGSKMGFLDNLKDSLKDLKYNVEDETTHLQEADIAQIVIDLSRREILYQMSLSIAGKLMSLSLLDFLR